MNMPGYSAGASLYLSSRLYAGSGHARGSIEVIVPAYMVCEPTCGCNIYDFPEPTCAKLCIDRPRGEPFAVECDPSECHSTAVRRVASLAS